MLLTSSGIEAKSSYSEKNTLEVVVDPETAIEEEVKPSSFFSLSFPQEIQMMQKGQDSTNIHSLSKFNFMFYFIYKLKYNEESSSGEFYESIF